MNNFWGNLATADIPALAQTPYVAFMHTASKRVQRIERALDASGACIVLTGEPGAGKSYLAQAAASAYAKAASHTSGNKIERIVIESLSELTQRSAKLGIELPRHESTHLLTSLAEHHDLEALVIVALNVDHYNAHDSAVLEHLVRGGQLRFVCTARELSGAADRLARNPDVFQFAVAPLTLPEADQLLSDVLGVDHITENCLLRWHTATHGNAHALMTIALAAEKRGLVQRANRYGWVEARDDAPPQDFVIQLGDLTPVEYANLELVAYASSISEPQLLRLLDSASITGLLNRQILTVHTDARGNTTLATRLPITGDAIRARISPVRRAHLSALCFDALNVDDISTTFQSASRSRLVRFGIDSGRPIPIDWVWQAMRESSRSPDLHFVLALALTAMPHDDPQRSADAILRACEIAHFLGNSDALRDANEALTKLLTAQGLITRVSATSQLELRLTAAYLNAMHRGDLQGSLEQLAAEQARWHAAGIDVAHIVQSHRSRLLALGGSLRAALDAPDAGEPGRDLESEFLTLPAQVFAAFIHIQRGNFKQALEIATTARQLAQLHEVPATVSGGIESLAIFLAHWARGTSGAAKRVIDTVPNTSPDAVVANSQAGLIDLAVALAAVQDGRWSDAARLAERLLAGLGEHDPFGVLELTQAIVALSRAVLGDTAGARAALDETERTRPGLSLTLRGFLEILVLRTKHWLRDTSLVEHAFKLATWASEEGLALIELEALDIAAHQQARPDPHLLERAERISSHIDSPIGDALLAHVRTLTHSGVGIEPEERLLSELGVWLPLPPTEQLTGREREIALFTSLGYSSKHVAERLHLSARTIETHLTNVYGKLGLNGREALREWFSSQRERLV